MSAGKKGGNKKPTMADQADRHVLYQKSVQTADVEVELLENTYRKLRKKTPVVFREDFCGTALMCAEWVKRGPERKAIGVDICKDTLQWGVEHNLSTLKPEDVQRITLLNENVLTVKPDAADIICAMNFSYCCFKDRATLRSYFENVYRGLGKDGIFAMDLLGGTATCDVSEEERDIEDDESVTYIWDQAEFNPITNEMKCYIHFKFSDGSSIDNAFEYDWRLWSIPELSELLMEVGFSKVRVYWEQFEEDTDDPENDYLIGTGEYEEVTEVDQQESWVSYIVAEK